MKESKRRRSLSGAVLIMILTVMFVLIILLTATLTMVTTASQRIYTKYEENQAYYTARSALDVFTQNMLSDSGYLVNPAKDFEYTDSDGVTIGHADMKQGEALQLDLYKIRSKNDDGIDLGYAENAVMSDSTFIAGSPEDSHFALNDTDSFEENGVTVTGLEYIEYNLKLPKVSDGSNKYGAMVDKAGFQIDSEDTSDVTIKVEVLDRKYATDPSYTTEEINNFINGGGSTPITSHADLQAAIQKGSRSKDYMKIKITSTVKMLDTDGVAVVIFETTEKDSPATDRALTTTGVYQGGSSGGLFGAGGGVTSLNPGNNAVGQGSTMSGPMFTVGSLEWAANPGSGNHTINKGESIIAYGDITFTNPAKFEAVDDGVFLYAGGTLTANGNLGYDGSSKPISIVCDTLKPFQNNYNINGNVFCDKFTTTQNMTISGSVYTNNLNVEYAQVDDSGNLKVSIADASVNMWSGGDINVVDWAGNVTATYQYSDYAGKIVATDSSGNPRSGTITSCGELKLTDFEVAEKDGKKYKKINLPGSLSSGCSDNFVLIPTVQANYGEYFLENAFDANGDLKDDGDPGNPYSQANINYFMMTGATLLRKYIDENYTVSGAQPTINDMISDGTITGVNSFPTSGGTITLDGSDKFYLLSNGSSYSGTVTVTGSSGRLIILIPENAYVNFNNFMLVTDNINDTTSTIINGTTKAPKVDIYGGSGSQIETMNNCLFTAYFTLPTGKIDEFKMGKQNMSYVDGQGASRELNQVGIVGSVLCGDFVTQSNAFSIAYLNKDSGASTPGEPHLTVQASQYVRN